MPQAAFMPFLMAPNAAVEAHIRPNILAIPVIARALIKVAAFLKSQRFDHHPLEGEVIFGLVKTFAVERTEFVALDNRMPHRC